MSKYKDMIFPNEEKINKEMKEEAIADAKMDVELDLHGAAKVVARAKKALASAKRQTGNNFQTKNIIEAQMALEDAEDNLERLQALQKELF